MRRPSDWSFMPCTLALKGDTVGRMHRKVHCNADWRKHEGAYLRQRVCVHKVEHAPEDRNPDIRESDNALLTLPHGRVQESSEHG